MMVQKPKGRALAKGTVSVLVVVALFLASFAFFGMGTTVHAQTLNDMTSGTANSTRKLNVTLSVPTGDGIVILEYIGPQSGPCSYPLTPTDSAGNTFTAIGSCVYDGGVSAAMEAYGTTSNVGSGSDTVTCKFASNTDFESCYVFDVSSAGSYSIAGWNRGYNSLFNVTQFTSEPYSLLLATVGIEVACGAVSMQRGWSSYGPSSACYSGYGMAGSWALSGSTGLTTTASLGGSNGNVLWAEIVVEVNPPPPSSTTTSTSYSTTITGWLVPSSTNFANTYILIIFPLAGMVLFEFPFFLVKDPTTIGDKAIFPALLGLSLGSAAADLATNGTAVLQVPFADVLVAMMLTFLWWWDS
jgi:hypothetical protein